MTKPGSEARLARATLVAVHGSLGLPAAVSRGTFIFLPEMRPLQADAVVQRLCTMAKPLVCVGVISGGQLHIGAWPVRESVGLGKDLVTMARDLFRRRPYPDLPDVLITSGGGDVVELTCVEFERWLGDYEVPLGAIALVPQTSAPDAMSSFLARVSPQQDDAVLTWLTDPDK